MDPQLLFGFEVVALVLTAGIMLYLLIGDNAPFRVVTYSFIGVAAGYVLVVAIFDVLLPRYLAPVLTGNIASIDFALSLVALVLGGLLLTKLSPRLAFLGNVSMAVLVGVGAAVAIGGAVFGTLIGQIFGAARTFPNMLGPLSIEDKGFGLLEGAFVLVGTVCTLAYFQFSAVSRQGLPPQRARLVEILGSIGQVFLGITLGAVFAGVYAASVAALIERLGFMYNVFAQIVGFFNR